MNSLFKPHQGGDGGIKEVMGAVWERGPGDRIMVATNALLSQRRQRKLLSKMSPTFVPFGHFESYMLELPPAPPPPPGSIWVVTTVPVNRALKGTSARGAYGKGAPTISPRAQTFFHALTLRGRTVCCARAVRKVDYFDLFPLMATVTAVTTMSPCAGRLRFLLSPKTQIMS